MHDAIADKNDVIAQRDDVFFVTRCLQFDKLRPSPQFYFEVLQDLATDGIVCAAQPTAITFTNLTECFHHLVSAFADGS